MYRITAKKCLNPTVTMMEIEAPRVAKKAQAGQFIILRTDEDGERIPLTIAGYDREAGTVTIIFQIVGATTMKLNQKEVGDTIPDFVGPLGMPTELAGLKRSASSAAVSAAPSRCPSQERSVRQAARSPRSSASGVRIC